ncbi:hypothetical protein O181_019933 [Austropuccinia psidii MF-1]|uniref:Uncharacterized protein n=1 Tax=Austropuccinia psidii MF-1 TaxID=1389203 RepID=A0A9Q3GU25_9BASI|nr:hypothetical protein [Austropuccinia psidii MF-1]
MKPGNLRTPNLILADGLTTQPQPHLIKLEWLDDPLQTHTQNLKIQTPIHINGRRVERTAFPSTVETPNGTRTQPKFEHHKP